MAQIYREAAIDAARIAGDDPEMDRVAQMVAADVRAEWGGHRRSGAIAGSIQTGRTAGKRGVSDREVFSTADGVLSAEFGHVAANGRYVPGVHAFGKAAGNHT